jgi:hypothetical protein
MGLAFVGRTSRSAADLLVSLPTPSRPTNSDEKLPVESSHPWPSRDRQGAADSPNFRPFFNGVPMDVRPDDNEKLPVTTRTPS